MCLQMRLLLPLLTRQRAATPIHDSVITLQARTRRQGGRVGEEIRRHLILFVLLVGEEEGGKRATNPSY